MIEIERLSELPIEAEFDGGQYVDALTRQFSRHPDSPRMTLRPIQAHMLVQAIRADGLIALAGCGEGKTLTSLLLPLVLDSGRPLILLPASMRTQFKSDFRAYGEAWRLRPIEVMSYEGLSSPSQVERLDTLAPDLIICDEAHHLKNLRSARVRRLERYLLKSGCRLCAMSGTMVSRSIRDYAHVANWALSVWSPLPRDNQTIDTWARVIEENDATKTERAQFERAMSRFIGTDEERIHARLRQSRGVNFLYPQRNETRLRRCSQHRTSSVQHMNCSILRQSIACLPRVTCGARRTLFTRAFGRNCSWVLCTFGIGEIDPPTLNGSQPVESGAVLSVTF